MTLDQTTGNESDLSATFADKAAAKKSAATALMEAIDADDTTLFAAALKNALKEEVDLNEGRGAFLHHAAEKKNHLMMKDLVIAGADINYAQTEAYKFYETIDKEDSDGKWYPVHYTLYSYMGTFAEKESKIQAVRQQEKIIRSKRVFSMNSTTSRLH
jgi:hypothetical protein